MIFNAVCYSEDMKESSSRMTYKFMWMKIWENYAGDTEGKLPGDPGGDSGGFTLEVMWP